MTISEKMLENAYEAQKLTRKHFVVELDFSQQSVRDLERIADDVDFTLSGGKTPENVELLSRTWGSYLGEVVCRTKDAHWVESSEQDFGASVQVGDKSIDPHELVRERLEGGPSLVEFYESIG